MFTMLTIMKNIFSIECCYWNEHPYCDILLASVSSTWREHFYKAWQLWRDNFGVTIVAWKLWLIIVADNCGWQLWLTIVAWQLWRDNCGVKIVADNCGWQLWLTIVADNCGVTIVAWQLWRDNCGVTIVAWQLWRDNCGWQLWLTIVADNCGWQLWLTIVADNCGVTIVAWQLWLTIVADNCGLTIAGSVPLASVWQSALTMASSTSTTSLRDHLYSELPTAKESLLSWRCSIFPVIANTSRYAFANRAIRLCIVE